MFRSHNTSDTLFQFFHPLCTMWVTSASSSPSSTNVDPMYVNVFTLFTVSPCNWIYASWCPLHPKYSVFLLLIFYPRSSIALLHSSSFLSKFSILVLHSTISSANSIHRRGCSLMPRPSTSRIMSNRQGLSDWGSTLTVILPVTPILVITCVRASSYVSFTRRTYFSGTPCSLKHLHTSCRGTLSYALSRSINTMCSSFCISRSFSIPASLQISHQLSLCPKYTT